MAMLLALVILLCLLPSPTISSSLASPHKHKIRWRRWARIRSDNSIGSDVYDKSCILCESDFDDDEEDEEYDDDRIQLDDESIVLSNSFRGGGAATTSRTMNLPGLHSGLRSTKKKKKNNKRRSNNPAKRKLQQLKQQQLQQIESIQHQKLRQIQCIFKKKQYQFQLSLYNLNSRINDSFPKPPYTLWKLDSDSPIIGKTTLTGKIFLLNIAMFGLQTIYPSITSLGAKRSDMIMEGRQLYRLLTPIFLHGGIGHLMANSYSLKSMGVNVERAFGQPRLLATYIVSGITGNILSAIQSPNPAVGASGAIFGLVGAYYTFLSRNQELFGYAGHMQKSALIETIGFNLLLGMTNPMIDNWGHIGGFIGGVGMSWLIGPKLYVAQIPIGSSSDDVAFGAGKVVIDRPFLTFRTPYFVDESMYWMNDNARKLGRRFKTSISNLLNSDNQEFFLDKYVDIGSALGSGSGSSSGLGKANGDNTIYRTLKGDIDLQGDVNVSPSDGFRQDVEALEAEVEAEMRQKMSRQQRRRAPSAGRPLRPRYGHLYR